MTIFKQAKRTPEFERDIKKLLKRFSTLEADLETCINNELRLYHKNDIDNRGVFPIPGLGFDFPKVFKGKKFACRSLKGKGVQSGIRVIYAYFEPEDRIELIEIYYKGDKENEDKARIIGLYSKSSAKFS